jgi:KDO2-lipid IV(A) lauroyltransferase
MSGRSLYAPKWWPTWIAIGILRVLEPLPFPVLVWLGRRLGGLVARLPLPYTRIVKVNLDLCFPDLTPRERRRIAVEHFRSAGISIFETAMSWWSPLSRIRKLTTLEGAEHLDAALARGNGVIILSSHFTMMEIMGRVLNERTPTSFLYRPSGNAVIEHFLKAQRDRHTAGGAIRRDDIRTLIRSLRNNEPVWYAPDQAYRKKGAEMVPFFGVPAATNVGTSRLAKLSGAPVVPYLAERLPGARGYRMVVMPPIENFPTDDPLADQVRLNGVIEAWIRRNPPQYLWLHRRFKGLSPDYPDYYGRRKK